MGAYECRAVCVPFVHSAGGPSPFAFVARERPRFGPLRVPRNVPLRVPAPRDTDIAIAEPPHQHETPVRRLQDAQRATEDSNL